MLPVLDVGSYPTYRHSPWHIHALERHCLLKSSFSARSWMLLLGKSQISPSHLVQTAQCTSGRVISQVFKPKS